MQKPVKTGKYTEINKQSDLKFWLHLKKYRAVSYSLSSNHEPKVFQNTFVNFIRCHSVYFGVITNSIFCWFCFRTKRTFPLLQSLLKKEFFPLENLRMFFFLLTKVEKVDVT